MFTGNRDFFNQFRFTQHLITTYDVPMQRKAESKGSSKKHFAKLFPISCLKHHKMASAWLKLPGRDEFLPN